jgi:hypothetical protein
MLVNDSDHTNRVALYPEIDRLWKSANQGAAGVAKRDGISQRTTLNALQCSPNLAEK